MTINLHATLKENFGFEKFRPNQEEIINCILSGQDTLAIMPTGGGKSICFQLPALVLPGTTIVISPLIALMKDQVDSLKANGIKACFINSSQSSDEQQFYIDALQTNEFKLVYIAPESLSYLDNAFNKLTISLIAIDEAHCISAWGHDFRPAYTNLGYLKNRFPSTPILALTATADKATRTDISDQLNLVNPKTFVASFDRKNLSLEVRPALDRVKQIIDFIDTKPNESGIIYCLSRKTTEELAEKLQKIGIKASAYHAGLDNRTRSTVQDAFINEIIVKNPMQLVKAPKQKSKQKTLFDEEEDVMPFNNAEIKLILEDKQLFEHNKNFYKLMLFTGMRPGEAVALRWQDILFDKKQIKIMQTRVAGKDGTPKTMSSMRYVDILPQTLEVLQNQQKLTGDKEYLFYTRSGKRYFSHDTLAASFKRLLTRNKIKERVLYNLRHTFASQMISQGVDIVWVSKTLGHKDVSITLSTYTKFIQEDEATRFQKLEKFGTIFDTLANS